MRFELRLATQSWLVLAACAGWSACSAPDGSDLFRPPTTSNGGAAGSAASGSGGSAAEAGAAGVPNGAGGSGEGQGGTLNLAGQSGSGGSSGDADASVPDAAAPDASAAEAGVDPVCEPAPEICDGVDNDCDGDADQGATCPQDCTGMAFGGSGYMFCLTAVEYADALDVCDDEDMRLAWLETPEENQVLVEAILGSGLTLPAGELLTYIGASDDDDEGEWTWIGTGSVPDGFQFWEGGSIDDGGSPVDDAYAGWASIEPNNQGTENCAAVSLRGNGDRQAGQWDDRDCDEAFPVVCEVP